MTKINESLVQASVYLESIQPVVETGVELVQRGALIGLSILVLDRTSSWIGKGQDVQTTQGIWLSALGGPFIEELVFRGVIQPVIQLAQQKVTYLCGWTLSKENQKAQQAFRVHLTALLFSATHLLNPHPNFFLAGIQLAFSYAGGVAYGYLSERVDGLAFPLLFHGMGNALSDYAVYQLEPDSNLAVPLTIMSAKIGMKALCYLIGTSKI